MSSTKFQGSGPNKSQRSGPNKFQAPESKNGGPEAKVYFLHDAIKRSIVFYIAPDNQVSNGVSHPARGIYPSVAHYGVIQGVIADTAQFLRQEWLPEEGCYLGTARNGHHLDLPEKMLLSHFFPPDTKADDFPGKWYAASAEWGLSVLQMLDAQQEHLFGKSSLLEGKLEEMKALLGSPEIKGALEEGRNCVQYCCRQG